MTKVLQLRRGTTAQNDAFTGAVGEVTVDTTKKTLRLHDGSTKGGKEIIGKSDLATVATSGSYNDLSNKLTIDTALSATSTNAVQNKAVKSALDAKVAKSGDTMTGTLTVAPSKNSIDGGTASGYIQINANGNSGGGQIRLHGKESTEAGAFQIWANNGTKEVGLVGRGTGSLTWGGKELVTANQLATVATSGSYSDLSNKPTIPTSGSVVTIVSSSYDSTTGSWYRKWSDGYIEQGGIVVVSTATVTLPIAFSDANYTIAGTTGKTSDFSNGDVKIYEVTKTSFKAVTQWDVVQIKTSQFRWMAIGK